MKSVKRLGNKLLEVKYKNLTSGRYSTEIFDYLIVASGAYSKPIIPDVKNVYEFNGLVLHSSQFRLNDPRTKGKNVLVVGGSTSGVDLSTHLVSHSRSVYHLFRRTPFVVPLLWKYKLSQDRYLIFPYEFILHTRELNSDCDDREMRQRIKHIMADLFPFQTSSKCPESLRIGENDELIIVLSDTYIDYVKEGKITPVKSNIEDFDETGVYLNNGCHIPIDVVIYCTGYNLGLDYLDRPILEEIKYRPSHRRMPIITYKSTFIPGYENLAFIGQTTGLCFTGLELQAKWVSEVFSCRLSLPRSEIMRRYVRDLEKNRDECNRLQYPYGSYVTIIDRIAEEMAFVNCDRVLEKFFSCDPVIWAHFLGDRNSRLEMLRFTHRFKSNVFALKSKHGDDFKQEEIIKEFSKKFKY